jgi:hypothetical protein
VECQAVSFEPSNTRVIHMQLAALIDGVACLLVGLSRAIHALASTVAGGHLACRHTRGGSEEGVSKTGEETHSVT